MERTTHINLYQWLSSHYDSDFVVQKSFFSETGPSRQLKMEEVCENKGSKWKTRVYCCHFLTPATLRQRERETERGHLAGTTIWPLRQWTTIAHRPLITISPVCKPKQRMINSLEFVCPLSGHQSNMLMFDSATRLVYWCIERLFSLQKFKIGDRSVDCVVIRYLGPPKVLTSIQFMLLTQIEVLWYSTIAILVMDLQNRANQINYIVKEYLRTSLN